ncbi:MAG: N-acetyltransferase [Sphingobacteriales bacterium]|nr:MAG: N-acetyltransferase [Sphingobacteriales bacterium]
MIQSGRIYLRALERNDLPSLQKWRNIKFFRDNFREYRELSYENQAQWYDFIQKKESNTLMFGVCDSTNNELIGAAGLCYINWVYSNADLSFYIGKDELYADDIFGRATVEAILEYGFKSLNLRRIWCELYETDLVKARLLGSIGFKKEGVLRDNSFKNGKFIDGHIWAILASEYKI